MLKIQPDSRQIPCDKVYTAEKSYNDLLYGILQEMSSAIVVDGNHIRYINKSDINFLELAKRVQKSRQTVATKFKSLISLGLVEYDELTERYILKYLDKSISALVPFETLRQINNALSQNCVSIFVYLMKRYIANAEAPFIVTIAQIKDFIGIAKTTTSNNEVVTDCLKILRVLGLVNYELVTQNEKSMFQVNGVNNLIKEC